MLSLTLDVEGAEDFRYSGLEDKWHTYRGRIKAGDNLKFDIRVKLADKKTLPITGRSCTMRAEVIAKKDGQVIEKKNFKADNKINVFFKYSVPEGTDTMEVSEVFVLSTKSKEEKFNQQCTTKNKLILTTTDNPAVAAKTDTKSGEENKKTDSNVDKKTESGGEKKTDSKNTENSNDQKADGNAENKAGNEGDKKSGDAGDKGEGGMSRKTMMAGAVAAIAAIVGGYFFMKKRKEDQAITEAIARKEKLRQQAIRKQQEMLQHNQQQRQEAMREPEQQADVNQQVQQPMEQNLPPQEQNHVPPQAGAAGMAGAAATMDNNVQKQPGFCQNCGAPLKPGTRFCENCGAKV